MKDKEVIGVIKFLLVGAMFMPLVIGGSISAFSFGKTILLRVLVEAALIFYLILIARNKSYYPKRGIILSALSIFVLSYFLSSVFSINPYKSFWGEPVRMGGFINLIHFFVFFVVASSILARKDFVNLFKVSIFVAFLITIYSFGQKIGGMNRPHGTIGNAALFAGYVLFNIFFAMYFLFSKSSSGKSRYLNFVFVALGSLAIYLTNVRGALLALFFGLLVFLYNALPRHYIKKYGTYFLVFAVIMVAAHVAFLKDFNFISDSKIISHFTDTTTLKTRFDGWNIAFQGWKVRPWLGWGPENFSVLYNLHFNPVFFVDSQTENVFDRAHNIFLEILSTQGIVGFLSFALLLTAVFLTANKKFSKSKEELAMVFAVLTAHIIHTAFIFDSVSSLLMFFLLLSFVASEQSNSNTKKAPGIFKTPSFYFYPAIFMVIIFLAYFINIKPLIANSYFSKAKLQYARSSIQSLKNFEKSIELKTPERFKVRRELASLVLTKSDFAASSADVPKEELLFAIQEINDNLKKEQLNVFDHLYLSSLYNNYGRIFNDKSYFDKSEQILLEAIKLFPNRQQVYYVLADAKLEKGEVDIALELLNKALELNPNSAESYWRLALAMKKLNNKDKAFAYSQKAEELIYHGTREYLPDLVKLIEINIEVKNYSRLAGLYTDAINLRPNYGQFYASLAAVYKELGNLAKAEEYARKAAEADSSFKSDSELFIKGLNLQK